MKIINSYCNQKINKKLTKKRLKQIKRMKIKYAIICIFGFDKIKFFRKHNIFNELGNKVLYQPRTLPNNPQLIKIHNNVKIAADVIFYEHDVINSVFENIDNKQYITHIAPVEIFDNVFIGGKSIIVGGVKIGPNSIIGAGSVITKDVPEGTIVAGNPAKIVGSFEELHKKREMMESNRGDIRLYERYKEVWEKFDARKN